MATAAALPLHASQRSSPQGHGSANCARGDGALHPMHPLHPLWDRRSRHPGTRYDRPRRALGDRVVRRQTIDSELSGNSIDVCPVGALTSKPFRYAARTWELARRKSVSPHDSLGSNLIVQVKGDRVMRVPALENEALNEWAVGQGPLLVERAQLGGPPAQAMAKQGGEWKEVDWQTALDVVAQGSPTSCAPWTGRHRCAGVAASTLERLALAGRFIRALGSDNIDFRLRQSDFRGNGGSRGSGCRLPRSERTTVSSSSAASCARTSRSSRNASGRRHAGERKCRWCIRSTTIGS